MTLAEQIEQRVALAHATCRAPRRWIATAAIAKDISDQSGNLLGLPVEIGAPRSSWGLELVCDRAVST